MATTQPRLLYIDGFAGPGEYEGGEDGSPIIALKVARDHILTSKLQRPGMELVFFFIEPDKARFQNLEQKLNGLQLPSNFKIGTECSTFEHAFGSKLVEIEKQSKRLAPSFVFIDPFGPTGFPMTLIGSLAQQPSSEVLINFNCQALNQWFLQDKSKHKYLDELYGSDIWHPALDISDSRQRENYLRTAYQTILEGFGWKVRPFRMINKHNQTQYFLFFATSNWRGMLAMKQAMWHASPTGDFQYSDLTNPQQQRLFDKESFDRDYSQELAEHLYKAHQGNSIPYQTLLRNDVSWHPICVERHLTQALKMLEYEAKPPKIIKVESANNKNRRRGSYKDCTITFAS